MDKGDWKKIGMGILAASVGATVFGAVQYMFLAGSAPTGTLFGVSYGVVIPLVLGALGFVGAYGFTKPGTIRDVLTFGSAAAIGFGIATYADWVTPSATPAARARAAARATASTRVMASYPARAFTPPTPIMTTTQQVKMI